MELHSRNNLALKAGILFYVYSMGFVIIWNTPNIYVEKCGEKSTIYFCTYTLCNRQWNGICKMLFLQKALFSYLFTLVAIYAAILRRTLTYTHLGKSHFEDVYSFIRCLLILINIYTKDIKRTCNKLMTSNNESQITIFVHKICCLL